MLDKTMIQEVFLLLDRDGYFNDETAGLGSNVVERRLDELEEALRNIGYDGPALGHGAQYYPECGNVYWVYDPRRMTAKDAENRTMNYVLNTYSSPI